MILEFPHKAPKDYSYQFEQFNVSTVRIVLCCSKEFDYNLGAPTQTVWGFYKPKKRTYYAPINVKTIGKEIDIRNTTPYTAMPLKRTPLEQFFV